MKFSVGALAGALIVAAATGCGGGGGGATSATGPTGGTNGSAGGNVPACASNTICMRFSSSGTTYTGADAGTGSFTPSNLTVAAGSTVTFSNASGVAHDVVFDAAAPQGGNIGVISSGTQSRTFTASGTYPFHCAIHEGMVGTVTVQ